MDDEHSLDLFYHALNYRGASTAHAPGYWNDLEVCHKRIVEAELSAYKAMCERLADSLSELTAIVKGECSALLDEDRGGSSRLEMDIDAALSDYRKLKGE